MREMIMEVQFPAAAQLPARGASACDGFPRLELDGEERVHFGLRCTAVRLGYCGRSEAQSNAEKGSDPFSD